MSKKTYDVIVEWSLTSILKVKAKSLDEAIDIADNQKGLPDDGVYMDGSYRVLEEATASINSSRDLALEFNEGEE